MLSTPLISCSIGVATVCDNTSAEAPGNDVFTTTVGGAISGYSVIGSARYEMYPTSVTMIDITAAKIGRSTKKWEKRIGGSLYEAAGRAYCGALRAGAALISPSSGLTFCPGRARGSPSITMRSP